MRAHGLEMANVRHGRASDPDSKVSEGPEKKLAINSKVSEGPKKKLSINSKVSERTQKETGY